MPESIPHASAPPFGSLRSLLASHAATALTVAAVLVAALTSVPPPYGLDALMFNYFNNASDARALFYFSGWLHLVPEAVAYALRGLPLTAQAIVYPLFNIATAVVMLREMQKLLRPWLPELESIAVSLLCLFYFHGFTLALNQFVWSVWFMAIGAFCYILRKNLCDERYSWFGLTAALLACLSNPVSVVLIPLLVLLALTENETALRRQNLVLAVLILAYFAAMAAFKPASTSYLSGNPVLGLLGALSRTVRLLRANGIITAAAVVALLWIAFGAWRERERGEPSHKVALWLAFLGLSSLAMFVLSGRVEIAGLHARYSFTCVVAAILATGIRVLPRFSRRTRLLAFAALALALAPPSLAVLKKRLPVMLADTRDNILFLRAADRFRTDCRPGDGLSSGPRRANLIVLCERMAVTRGANGPAVAVRDKFDNAFVAGPPARIWRTGETTQTLLLSPP